MASLSVSVALASCNGANWLADQLSSIDEQDRKPSELVISDDGSEDDTLEVVGRFAARARFPVRVLSNRHRAGPNGNFERAILACRGEVVLTSDQDDRWLPDHVSRIVAAFEKDPGVSVVVSNSRYADVELRPLDGDTFAAGRVDAALRRPLSPDRQFATWARQRFALGHGMGFRRQLAVDAFPVPTLWNYDDWLTVVGAALGRAVLIDDVLTLHRQHARQHVGHRPRGLLERLRGSRKAAGGSYHTQQLDAWLQLSVRLEALRDRWLHPDVGNYLEGRRRCLERRQQIALKQLPGRLVHTLPMWLNGSYARYGQGFRSFAFDVLQRS